MREFALAGLLVVGAQGARAAESAAFLDIGVGARCLGMGGACTALSDDADSLNWNPAGLAKLDKREVTASHAELPANTRLDFLAYAHPTRQGTFAAGLTYLSHGRIEGRDSTGRPTTGFDASDAAVTAAYALKLEFAELGANLKYIRSHIGGAEAQSVATDVGAKRAYGDALFGAAIRNLGPGLKFQDQRNDLPLRLALSAAYKFAGGHAAAAEAVNGPRGAGTDASFGGEYQAAKNLYLRAGYTTRTAITGGTGFDAARGLTMGLGWRREKWGVDYAVLPSGEIGRSHRFSLSGRW